MLYFSPQVFFLDWLCIKYAFTHRRVNYVTVEQMDL